MDDECALWLGFQDKVANFWCAVSVLVKVRQILPVQVLLILWWAPNWPHLSHFPASSWGIFCFVIYFAGSIVVTLLAVLPSTINLLFNPSPYRFLLSLVSKLGNHTLLFAYFTCFFSGLLVVTGKLFTRILSFLVPRPWEIHFARCRVSTCIEKPLTSYLYSLFAKLTSY